MPAVDDFLKTVLRSGLLDRGQLQESLRTVPRDQREDPEALAEHLVRAGKLSRFQARKILQGAARGLVLGPFQVLAPIGRGGMGTVYLARDSRGGQLLALKVLPPKRAREEERLLKRFQREMEMCQRVSHPHLAYTYDIGVCNGVHFIAMEYIPGKSLYRVVAEEGPLRVPRAARLFAEVASALDHAHSQGLIHRDLKPSNILVTPHDHAKVLDLGLALMQGENCAAREVVGGEGYVVGTMDYIAPEQTEDACKVDARSDIYALGCTLYYALTGRQPFAGGTSAEKIRRHRTEEPAPVPQFNPDVPPGFIGVLRRMMAKRPEHRFASAAALRDELLAWAAGEPALPMDKPEDAGYREAVAQLEAAEPSDGEAQAEVIPVGILESATPPAAAEAETAEPELPPAPRPKKPRSGTSPVVIISSPRVPRTPPPSNLPFYLLFGVLGALVGLALLGVLILVLLLVLGR
jgi:eukaryotic-like serine/threonine-protein kinase